MILAVLLLLLLGAFVVTFMITSEFIAFLRTRVPFVPTNQADVEFFVKILGLDQADVFYDLGSGNGKVIFLVKKLSGARGVGFELGWWTVLYAKFKALLLGSRAKFYNRNFFKANWQEADFIYAYLYPPLMRRIKDKFLAECRSGAIMIVRDFPLPDLKPDEVYFRPRNHEIYIYKKIVEK